MIYRIEYWDKDNKYHCIDLKCNEEPDIPTLKLRIDGFDTLISAKIKEYYEQRNLK